MINVVPNRLERVSQGDIYRDVEFLEAVNEAEGNIEIVTVRFPLVIVMTQDCDLAQDNTFRLINKAANDGSLPTGKAPPTQDKYLLSVLVAPIYNEEFVLRGDHLDQLGMKMQAIKRGSTQHGYLMQNGLPRYHYLEFPNEIPIPLSVIDFKHYFSVSVKYLMEQKANDFVCRVDELYRESISQRFSSFLSRIGLPDNKETQ